MQAVILSEAKNLVVGKPEAGILRRGEAPPQNDNAYLTHRTEGWI
jgi:hypothetical protein